MLMKHIESNQDTVCIAASTIIGEKAIICRSLQPIKLILSPTSYHNIIVRLFILLIMLL